MHPIRLRLRWLGVALGVAASPVLAWLVWDALVHQRLERVRHAFAEEGFPSTAADLTPAPASDDDNAALLLGEVDRRMRAPDPTPLPAQAPSAPATDNDLFQGLKSTPRSATLRDRADRIVDLYLDHLQAPLTAGPPTDDVLAELHALFDSPELTAVLALAHRASTRPRFVQEIDFSKGPAFTAEHIGTIRTLARLLNARAALVLRTTRDADAVWRDLLGTERLGRLAAETPSLINVLTSIACSGINHRNLVDAMSAEVFPPDDAEVLAFLLSLQPATDGRFARALAFERVIFLDWTANWMKSARWQDPSEEKQVAEAFLFPSLVTKLPRPVRRTWMFAQVTRNYEAYLAMARILRDHPRTTWIRDLQDLSDSVGDEPMMGPVKTFGKVVITDLADQARHSAVVIALAASMRRRATGAWPASVAELGLPDSIGVDPCSGHPMHYVPSEDRLLVYADGPDGKDDGGRDWQSGDERSIQDGDIVVQIKLSR